MLSEMSLEKYYDISAEKQIDCLAGNTLKSVDNILFINSHSHPSHTSVMDPGFP